MEITLAQVIEVLDAYYTKHLALPREIVIRGTLSNDLRVYKAANANRDKAGEYFTVVGVRTRQERKGLIEIIK